MKTSEPSVGRGSPQFKDLNGKKFGRLIVTQFHGRNKGGRILWRCTCDCGNAKIATGHELSRGDTSSCGCLKSELISERNTRTLTTHGLRSDPVWQAWRSMISRCTSPKDISFKNYGARGISVCRFLFSDPRNLKSLIGEKTSPLLSLDRIDSNGHYSCGQCIDCSEKNWPMNVRWLDRALQNRNTRANRMITYHGQTMCLAEWAEFTGLSSSTILGRIKRGWPTDLLFKPLRYNPHR